MDQCIQKTFYLILKHLIGLVTQRTTDTSPVRDTVMPGTHDTPDDFWTSKPFSSTELFSFKPRYTGHFVVLLTSPV